MSAGAVVLVLPLGVIQGIADEVAEGTFGRHLERVRGGRPGDSAAIAEGLNLARNALLHWRRERFSLPVYKGQDVTSDEGFRAFMDDVLRCLQTVPFERPITGDTPVIQPRHSHVAILGNSTTPGNTQLLKETRLAAAVLGVRLQYIDVRDP